MTYTYQDFLDGKVAELESELEKVQTEREKLEIEEAQLIAHLADVKNAWLEMYGTDCD